MPIVFGKRSHAVFLIAVAITFTARLHADAPVNPAINATYARLDSIDVTGNLSFSDASIKHELFAQPEFLVANHPMGNQQDFQRVVRELLIKGYRYHGFPDVSVELKAAKDKKDEYKRNAARQKSDSPMWTINIIEGKQILCAGVRVSGTNQIDVEQLTQRLTQPYPNDEAIAHFVHSDEEVVTLWVDGDGDKSKLEDAIWNSGKGVPIGSEEEFHRQVVKALSDVGFSNATVIVRFDLDKTNAKATLVVDVIDEGAKDRVQTITIGGLNINDRDSLLAFLDLSDGDRIDRQKIQDIARMLWESGRFEKQSVKFDPKTGTLKMQVVERKELPRIDRPLNKNAEILLKMSRWLTGLGVRGDDMEFNVNNHGVRIHVIYSEDGILFEVLRDETNDNLTMLIDKDHLLIDHSQLGEKLCVFPNQDVAHLRATFRCSASDKPDKFSDINLSFTASQSGDTKDGLLSFDLLSSPSDWLPMAYQEKIDKQSTDSKLILARDEYQIQIDSQSGRINKWVRGNDSARFAPGLFRAARQACVTSLATKPAYETTDGMLTDAVLYITSDPVTRSIRTALDTETDERIDQPLVSALRRLIDDGLLRGFDMAAGMMSAKGEPESYSIPGVIRNKGSLTAAYTEVVARATLLHAHKVFDEETWPLILTREVALVLLGSSAYTNKVLEQLISDPQTGPIGLATIAALLKTVKAPPGAINLVSKHALHRLNPSDFSSDFALLTRIIPAESITQFRKSIASLDPEEIDALAKLVVDENWDASVRKIHAVGNTDGAELSEADFWYLVCHEPLESWLKNLASVVE